MTTGKEAKLWKPEGIFIDENMAQEIVVPYGNSQDKLVPGLHYPKPSSGGGLFYGSTSYTTTGVKTITGVGFTPKMIKIRANQTTTFSDGTYFNGSESCRYFLSGGGALDAVGNIGYSSYNENSGNASITTTITPTADGFTINVTNISGTLNIQYGCYA